MSRRPPLSGPQGGTEDSMSRNAEISRERLAELLERTSRTFALSIPLLREPTRSWDDVALTTYGAYGNFTVRDDHHRYIVYADGSEELYDLAVDPHQWTNLADDPAYLDLKQALSGRLPPAETHVPEHVGEEE